MQQNLEAQANLIEQVLSTHKIHSRVWGGSVTPRFIRYDLTTAAGIRVQKVLALKDEIALMLSVSDVRMYRKDGAIRIEVPRSRPSIVRLLPLVRSLPKLPPLSAVLGVDEEGVPLLLRLPSPDVAHMLVAGTTGSGKTALLRSILLSLAMHNPQRTLQMVLIDPKRRGFGALSELPHLIQPVIAEADDAIETLQDLVSQMERRDQEKRNSPALVVVIDELADLRMVGGKKVEDALSRLTQRGREAGIHVIVATQRPAATVVGSLVKANLPVRLVGAVGSPEDAKVATGIAGSGAELLRGRGDFLLVARGRTIRLQAAYIDERETELVAKRLSSAARAQDSTALKKALHKITPPSSTHSRAEF